MSLKLPPLGELADLDKPCYDKVALLIGNRNYRVGKMMLNTPENDTQDLGGVLRSAGFKVVSLVNLSKQEMEQVIIPLGVLRLVMTHTHTHMHTHTFRQWITSPHLSARMSTHCSSLLVMALSSRMSTT